MLLADCLLSHLEAWGSWYKPDCVCSKPSADAGSINTHKTAQDMGWIGELQCCKPLLSVNSNHWGSTLLVCLKQFSFMSLVKTDSTLFLLTDDAYYQLGKSKKKSGKTVSWKSSINAYGQTDQQGKERRVFHLENMWWLREFIPGPLSHAFHSSQMVVAGSKLLKAIQPGRKELNTMSVSVCGQRSSIIIDDWCNWPVKDRKCFWQQCSGQIWRIYQAVVFLFCQSAWKMEILNCAAVIFHLWIRLECYH